MSISKQSLQLSQDLMDLQSQYNATVIERDELKVSARFFRDESFRFQNELHELKKEIAILKEIIPSAIAFVPKKKVSRAK